ncbi:MAG: hypothetical protein JXR07_01895 [Reichenbachiella sp.]
MEAFEYFVVMSSLILGLGIAQILMGFSDLIAHYSQVRFSLTHIIYAIVVFIIHLQDWWYSYQYSLQIENWTFLLTIGLFTFHIILFLQARILFPTGARSQETDMVKYFGENWRLLYSLGSLTVLISIIKNLTLSNHTLIEIWPQPLYLAIYLAFILLNVKNYYAHVTFVTLQLMIWIIIIATDPYVIH